MSSTRPPLDLTLYRNAEIAEAIVRLPIPRIRGIVMELRKAATPIVVGVFLAAWAAAGQAVVQGRR